MKMMNKNATTNFSDIKTVQSLKKIFKLHGNQPNQKTIHFNLTLEQVILLNKLLDNAGNHIPQDRKKPMHLAYY